MHAHRHLLLGLTNRYIYYIYKEREREVGRNLLTYNMYNIYVIDS